MSVKQRGTYRKLVVIYQSGNPSQVLGQVMNRPFGKKGYSTNRFVELEPSMFAQFA